MKHLLLKYYRSFSFKNLLLLIGVIFFGVVWLYNPYKTQFDAAKYDKNMEEHIANVVNDESAFDEFVFVTVPKTLNSVILKPFIGLLGFALGGAFNLPFVPSAIKEHFTESPRRVVSFFFLIFMVLALIKFLASMLGLAALKEKLFGKNFLENIGEHFSSGLKVSLYDKGYKKGYALGYYEAHKGCWEAKNLEEEWYKNHNKNPLAPKLKRILNYVLFFVLLLEIMLAISSDPDFKMTDLDNSNVNVTVNADTAVFHDEKN